MHFTSGLSGRRFWLYDLFDPLGGTGEGHRLPAHAPDLVVKVRARFQRWRTLWSPRVKSRTSGEASPDQIAFLHIDMNHAEAERGALENLFSRVSTGGM